MGYTFDIAVTEGYYTNYAADQNFGKDISLSFWYKTTNTSDFMQPTGLYDGVATNYLQNCFNSANAYAYSAEGIYVVTEPSGGAASKYIIDPGDNSTFDGNWHNYVITIQDVAGSHTIKIYLDGVVTGSQTASGTATDFIFDSPLAIGGQNRPDLHPTTTISAGSSWDGSLAEYAMWSRTLTADDAKSLTKVKPLLVHPVDLEIYHPLTSNGPENDLITGIVWDIEGTPDLTDHPPVTSYPIISTFAAAGPDVNVSVALKALTLATQKANLNIDIGVDVASLTLTANAASIDLEQVNTIISVAVASLNLQTHRAIVTPQTSTQSFLRDLAQDIARDLVNDLVN